VPRAPAEAAAPTSAAEPLPATNPVAFLEQCLKHYDEQHIQGYRLTMEKQERIGGKIGPVEVLDVSFRAHPYSVRMRWISGAQDAQTALYVQSENNDQMLVHPSGLAGKLVSVVPIDPEGSQAHRETLYSIKDFGLKKAMQRTLADWKEAQAQGELHVTYHGVRDVPELGDRPCYEFRRTQEADPRGVTGSTIYIDLATLFQTGTYLTQNKQRLIAKYLYREIQLNPTFVADEFTSASLTE
jgi:outer membrane lipoprotein-sorting protein